MRAIGKVGEVVWAQWDELRHAAALIGTVLGLVLATPMTVCLVVMGRHIPRMSFLSVLLSDKEALTPAEDCYYRLLTVGEQDEIELVESYLKANSLTALYDSVLIPVITAVEIDYRQGRLDDEQRALVEQSLRDIVEDLSARPPVPSRIDADTPGAAPPWRVYCLPAHAERDELAGTMLVQLLQQHGFEAHSAPAKLPVDELLALVKKAGAEVVCISVVAPSTVLHARYLCLKLRALLPKQRIVVGLWRATENVANAARRVRDSGADEVVTTLADAVLQLAGPRQGVSGMSPAPIPAENQVRPIAVVDEDGQADIAQRCRLATPGEVVKEISFGSEAASSVKRP
jgi:hypothetical protein